ncbi:hypothetical protein [Oceanobacter kriegii]|uniref:hypothetical protein n=1 Tax=Oceanobacter kriegii TaxID=64972 RepID=UPI0004202F79|nr:hypothetical protein [Oceanobacter kriegii]
MNKALLISCLVALASCSGLQTAQQGQSYSLGIYDYNAPNGEVQRGREILVTDFFYRNDEQVDPRKGLQLKAVDIGAGHRPIKVQPQDIRSFHADLEHMLKAADGEAIGRPMAGYSLRREAVREQQFLSIRNQDESYELRLADAERIQRLVQQLMEDNESGGE